MSTDSRTREARLAVAVVAGTVVVLGGVALVATRDSDEGSTSASPAGVAGPTATTTRPADATTIVSAAAPAGDALVEAAGEGCVIKATTLAVGDAGPDVSCLQHGLINAGYTSVQVTGTYDTATYAAVEQLQTERDLFVDGVVGRETALSIGVWPAEENFVVRTPPPPPGAEDSWGFPLSSVATTGATAPPLPANSGAGKRVVYERRSQRVWAVDEHEEVIRSWLVSGSMYDNELPGTYEVYSRTEESTSWDGESKLPLMIRWLERDGAAIGFHGIPIHVSDGTPYQTEAELGARLSDGCQRQARADAEFLWAFAPVGTTVVVL